MNRIICWLCLFCMPSLAFSFGVDLHAHLFMDEGVNIIYRDKGFFHSHIQAKKWNHSRSSQVNEALFLKTELSIVVVSLYAAPILAGEPIFESILKQITAAEKFIKRNPNWIIAHSSAEAKKAIAQGKKVLVLSIEGGEKVVNTPEQLEILQARGVRIITLLHLTKDRIGSPALLDPLTSTFSTPIGRIICNTRDRNGVRINCNGLTKHGKEVADRLMDAGIWIDLAHASDKAIEELLPKFYARNIPLLFTHGSMRSKLKQERGVSTELLGHYKKLGGMFGITPSKKLLGKTDSCHGTVDALREHYDLFLNYLSPDQIAVGTDTNGMLNHIKPRSAHAPCNIRRIYTKFDENGGWWNYSHTFPLWNELNELGPGVATSEQVVKRFLSEWSRVEEAAHDDGV